LSPVAVEIDEAGQAKALKVAGEQNGAKVEATLPARTILVAAGTQPNTVLAREDATHAFIDGKYFRALDEEGNPATPERVCKPGDVRVLMYRHADNRFMSFFGDLHPSFAGNVVKAMGGAKQGYPVLTRSMTALPLPKRTPAEILGEANRAWRARVVPRRPPDAHHHRGHRRGAGRGAQLRAWPVLPAAELRGALAARRGHASHHGRPRADRGLGRQGEGTAVADRAGDGWLIRPLRHAEAGRAGDRHGADGRTHRDRAGRDRGAGGRRPRQRRAVLDRAGLPQGRQQGAVLRWLQEDDRPLQGRGDRGGGRCRRLVLRRGPRLRARPAAGQVGRHQHRRGDAPVCFGRAGRPADPLQRRRPHRGHRFGRHDERRAPGAARGAQVVSQARTRGLRFDQLPHAMHDEGDLRPVPAAPQGPGDRQGDRGLLLLQPGPAPRPRRLRQPAPAPAPELRAGKDRRAVDRPLAQATRGAGLDNPSS
ncbi:hypothetical protein OSTOST_13178, partial [Ostertagia ostertagi]